MAGACVDECRASAVGRRDGGDEKERRGLYLVKLIANNDFHDFR
jgi:hypothetical protein